MPAVTSSKSVSGTPLETKRGAQWWIAISTRLSFGAAFAVSIFNSVVVRSFRSVRRRQARGLCHPVRGPGTIPVNAATDCTREPSAGSRHGKWVETNGGKTA